MDLADLNGHVFVNDVSLGLYAAIVRSPAYRDATVDTTLSTLPQVLGRRPSRSICALRVPTAWSLGHPARLGA